MTMGLLQAVNTQRRVVWALIVRELQITRGSERGGYLRALTKPLTLLVMLLFVRTALINQVGLDTINPLTMVTGFLVFFMWRGIATKLMGASNTVGGIFVFPQVSLIDLFLAQSVIVAYIHAFLLFAILVLVHFLSVSIPVDAIEYVILAVLLAWLNGLGAGLFAWGLVANIPLIRFIPNMLFKVMFWISGVFFSASNLPLHVQAAAKWNPVTICLEMARHGVGLPSQSIFFRPHYAFLCALGLIVGGLLLSRYAWRGKR